MNTAGVYAMNLLVLTIVVIILATTFGGGVSSSVTVHLPGQGSIQGDYQQTAWSNQTFMRFLGVPYAASPSGKLRFKHAEKRLAWRHVLDATRHGRRCPVITTIRELSASELKQDLEDCLNLCVYSKNLTARSPVMFYIYGGGFYNGSNIDHPPNFLLEKDIVLVVPNYRIGALGWLATRSREMPGNAPISDLLAALEWVQQFIGLFGGDPQQVTIFGQSAGTAMSGSLLLSPRTPAHFFQRSIQQSGSIFAQWALNQRPVEQAVKVCRALGCDKCEPDDEGMYQCLRDVSVPKFLALTEQESFSPIIDDFLQILPGSLDELYEQYNRSVTLMAGFTKHDGSFILASLYDAVKATNVSFNQLTVKQFVNVLLKPAEDSTGILNNVFSKMLFNNELLYSNDHKKAIPGYFDLTNDLYMRSPVITMASRLFQKHLAPVYLYSFDYEGSNTRFGYEFGNEHYPFEGGVHHSNDNIYLFPTHTLNSVDSEMARKMVELWTSFAIHGEPRVAEADADLPQPAPMSTETGPYFHINSKITMDWDVLKELTAALDDPENYKLNRPDVEF